MKNQTTKFQDVDPFAQPLEHNHYYNSQLTVSGQAGLSIFSGSNPSLNLSENNNGPFDPSAVVAEEQNTGVATQENYNSNAATEDPFNIDCVIDRVSGYYPHCIRIGYSNKYFQLVYPVYYYINTSMDHTEMYAAYEVLNNKLFEFGFVNRTELLDNKYVHINEDRNILIFPVEHFNKFFYENKISQKYIKIADNSYSIDLNTQAKLHPKLIYASMHYDGLKDEIYVGKLHQYKFEIDKTRQFYHLVTYPNGMTIQEAISYLMALLARNSIETKIISRNLNNEYIITKNAYYDLLEESKRNPDIVKMFHLDSTLDWYFSRDRFFRPQTQQNYIQYAESSISPNLETNNTNMSNLRSAS